MGRGRAVQVKIDGVEDLADLIARLGSDQAIALGALRSDLPDQVGVVTKDKLDGQRDVIARTGSRHLPREGHSAYLLLDYDTKGMTAEVETRLAALGGFWNALVSVVPALGEAAHVIRQY